MTSSFSTILKGFLIGSTMIVPGISGGSMAMILGIYDKLVMAVSSLVQKPRTSLSFLFLFAVSAVTGIIFFSSPLSWLLASFPAETMYFFLGAVLGGIPLIEKKSRLRKMTPAVLFYLLLGLSIVLLLSQIPENALSNQKVSFFTLAAFGLFASAALVLPGISFSHFLLTFGLYDKLLFAVKHMEMDFLLPLLSGLVLGILLLTKLLDYWMQSYPRASYLTILGFVLGSALLIFPGLPAKGHLFPCILLAAAGFFAAFRLSQMDA